MRQPVDDDNLNLDGGTDGAEADVGPDDLAAPLLASLFTVRMMNEKGGGRGPISLRVGDRGLDV